MLHDVVNVIAIVVYLNRDKSTDCSLELEDERPWLLYLSKIIQYAGVSRDFYKIILS